jgi:hypothetical protein
VPARRSSRSMRRSMGRSVRGSMCRWMSRTATWTTAAPTAAGDLNPNCTIGLARGARGSRRASPHQSPSSPRSWPRPSAPSRYTTRPKSRSSGCTTPTAIGRRLSGSTYGRSRITVTSRRRHSRRKWGVTDTGQFDRWEVTIGRHSASVCQVLRLLISGEMPVDRVAESPSHLCDNCTRASSWAAWSRALFRSWSGTFSTAGGPRRVERPANGW